MLAEISSGRGASEHGVKFQEYPPNPAGGLLGAVHMLYTAFKNRRYRISTPILKSVFIYFTATNTWTTYFVYCLLFSDRPKHITFIQPTQGNSLLTIPLRTRDQAHFWRKHSMPARCFIFATHHYDKSLCNL